MATTRDTNTGRKEFSEWEDAQPDNFYTTDGHLQSLLEFHWGRERLDRATPRLMRFGAEAATIVDDAVRRANLHENLPRLDRFSAIGERTENIIHSRDHDIAGDSIYGSGAMSVYSEPGNNLLALTLFYISSYNGEAGHNCPLACTAGVIKTLQQVGSESLRARYLPRLLDASYTTRYHGAQFLTEVQGGSDVGANSCRATELDPSAGTWLLNGEKWFCSNASADLALVTARPEGGEGGTRGLGLFLVPRLLDDGKPNGLYLRRLKDKIGTRSLATAEIDFRDAVCFEIDAQGRGFQHVMDFVVNTSRVYNAVGSAAAARRALVVAWTYARHRRAFGTSISQFPLIAEALAEMRCETMALVSGSLYLAHLRDLIETGVGGTVLTAFFRLSVNLNKYRASLSGTIVIRRAMEILGGNGAMESFSVLPRLLRDSLIFEAWEGAHNTLLVQCLRDIRRLGLHDAFCETVSGMFGELRDATWREAGIRECQAVRAQVEELRSESEQQGSVFFRPLADRMMYLFYAACLSREAEWEERQGKNGTRHVVVDFLWQRILNGSRTDYLRQIAVVSGEI
ncbi:MAG: acyl-CoA dehydrogenase family protein [Acidobacteriota bacterium]